MEGLEWRKSRCQEWVDVGESMVGEIAYQRLPIDAVIAMTRGVATIGLAAVDRPVLLVTSANDDVVDPNATDAIAAILPGDVRRLRLRCSGHVATLDVERDVLQRAAIDFIRAESISTSSTRFSGSTGSHPTHDR